MQGLRRACGRGPCQQYASRRCEQGQLRSSRRARRLRVPAPGRDDADLQRVGRVALAPPRSAGPGNAGDLARLAAFLAAVPVDAAGSEDHQNLTEELPPSNTAVRVGRFRGPREVPRGCGGPRGTPFRWRACAAPPLTCEDRWRGRSWDQVGGEKRAPDLVPLPRQDQEEGTGQRGRSAAGSGVGIEGGSSAGGSGRGGTGDLQGEVGRPRFPPEGRRCRTWRTGSGRGPSACRWAEAGPPRVARANVHWARGHVASTTTGDAAGLKRVDASRPRLSAGASPTLYVPSSSPMAAAVLGRSACTGDYHPRTVPLPQRSHVSALPNGRMSCERQRDRTGRGP